MIVACPAWAAARVVAGWMRGSAKLLGAIDYSSSVTLSLIYRAAEFDGKRAGFGFLVPQKERQRLAACTFVGTKFSYRVPDDRIVLRCFFGGINDAAVLEESDEALVGIAREELRRMLGLTAAPICAHDCAVAAVDGAVHVGAFATRRGDSRAGGGDSWAVSGGERLRGDRHSGLHQYGAGGGQGGAYFFIVTRTPSGRSSMLSMLSRSSKG